MLSKFIKKSYQKRLVFPIKGNFERSLFFFLLFFMLSRLGYALYDKPWFGDVYASDWQSAFTYSRYRKVADAAVQLQHPSNDKLLSLDLGFVPSAFWDVEAEIEFAATPRQKFNWRSIALQGRYRWLDDINGDSCSLVSGFSVRQVSGHSLRDVSCPYHSNINFELTNAVGKEWSKEGLWMMRTYGLAGLGIANHGSAWLRMLGGWEINHNDSHRLMLGIESYFGFGNIRHIDVNHFHGYAQVHHQSIDLTAGYAYHMRIWGSLGVNYTYRPFAKSFPEHVNFVTLFYHLPFSFF